MAENSVARYGFSSCMHFRYKERRCQGKKKHLLPRNDCCRNGRVPLARARARDSDMFHRSDGVGILLAQQSGSGWLGLSLVYLSVYFPENKIQCRQNL